MKFNPSGAIAATGISETASRDTQIARPKSSGAAEDSAPRPKLVKRLFRVAAHFLTFCNCYPLPSFKLVFGVFHLVLLSSLPAQAVIVLSNCPNPTLSTPMPKRVVANCARIGLPNFDLPSQTGFVDPSGGFNFSLYAINGTNSVYSGLGRAFADGEFRSLWAVTNGWFYPAIAGPSLPDEFRLVAAQTRDLGMGPKTTFGLYSETEGGTLSPIVETQLPIGDYRQVIPVGLPNGYIVTLDQTNAIDILGFDSGGELAWAKRLSSAEFPVFDELGQLRKVDISLHGTNEVLLTLTGADRPNDTCISKVILVSIDSEGTLGWSRKAEMPANLTFCQGAISIHTLPSGELFLINYVNPVKIIRLDANAQFLWGRMLEGVWFGSGVQVDRTERLVLGLTAIFPSEHVIVAFDSSGNLDAATRLDLPDGYYSGVTASSPIDGRIYYAGNHTNESGLGRAFIGWSSSELTSFDFYRYTNSFSDQSPELQALEDGRLLFLVRDHSNRWVDTLLLDPNLRVGSCDVFEPFTITNADPGLAVQSFVPVVTDVAVQATDLNLVLDPGEIILEQVAVGEETLCRSSCPPLHIEMTSSNTVLITWPDTELNCDLVAAPSVSAAEWMPVFEEYFLEPRAAAVPIDSRMRFFRLLAP